MARQRAPLPFGGGIDRDTGATVVEPYEFQELRNVYLTKGRMEFRRGLLRRFVTPGADPSDVLGIWPLSATGGQAAIAVYHRGTKQVWLYVADAAGSVSDVGFLWSIPAGAIEPPRVLAAEAYNKLVLAHDEPQYALRGATVVMDVPTRTLDVLRADFAGPPGNQTIYFRGVEKYLNYVIGWGFGDENEPNRPEILRISMPGEPTVFDKMHYFLVGQRGDPIIGGGFAGGKFAVQKVAETYALAGYDRSTFGIQPLDLRFGLVNSRLRLTVEGDYYFWAAGHGPRMIAAGTTESIELPLDIDGALPEPTLDLEMEQAFAFYDPSEDEVVFSFGDFGFTLHRKDDAPRWSYRQYAKPLMSAGMIYEGGAASVAIGSEPTAVVVTPITSITYGAVYLPGFGLISTNDNDVNPRFQVTWTPSAPPPTGTQAEIWVRSLFPTGPFTSWQRKWIGSASGGGVITPYLHDFLTNHQIAVRFVLFGTPGVGYQSANPLDWPAASRVTALSYGGINTLRLSEASPSGANWRSTILYLGLGRGRSPGVFWGNYELTFETEYRVNGGAWTAYSTSSGAAAAPPTELIVPGVVSGDTLQARVRVTGQDDATSWAESNVVVIP